MELEYLQAYLLAKKGAFEEFPFGPTAMVYKVMGKMFALIGWLEMPLWINLKCDPELALHLREVYRTVKPGYHMNKKHWNTVTLDGSIPHDEILSQIDDSYSLVIKGMKKADRKKIKQL